MDDKISNGVVDDGQSNDEESGFYATLNDILKLPVVTVPFDDNMRMLAREIESLNNEEIFRKISEITKIHNYPFDLRSYWLIDIIAGFLINGNKEGLSGENLWAMLGWFMFIFNGFRENKWVHESLMQHIQSVILASSQEVKMREQPRSSDDGPSSTISAFQRKASKQTTPSNSRQRRASKKENSISSTEIITQSSKGNKKPRHSKNTSIPKLEVLYTLEDLLIIVNIFYDLFATEFQFKLIQWSLLDLDQVIILEWPHHINVPRDLKVQTSTVPQEPIKSGSAEELKPRGKDRNSKKKKSKGHSEADTIKEQRLQQEDKKPKSKEKKLRKNKKGQSEDNKTKEQQELQQEEEKPKEIQENWEVDDNIYILPLQEADGIGKDFFLKLFKVPEDESTEKKKKIPDRKKGKKKKGK